MGSGLEALNFSMTGLVQADILYILMLSVGVVVMQATLSSDFFNICYLIIILIAGTVVSLDYPSFVKVLW